MTLLPMYTAMWEWKATTRDERQAEAEEMWLARTLLSASEEERPKDRSAPQKSALKRLVTSLGQAGA